MPDVTVDVTGYVTRDVTANGVVSNGHLYLYLYQLPKGSCLSAGTTKGELIVSFERAGSSTLIRNEIDDDHPCESEDYGNPPGGCRFTDTTYVEGGCRHEHIGSGWLCAFHIEHTPDSYCGPCYDIDGHKCALTVRPVPSC
jgi:hypothetical protein